MFRHVYVRFRPDSNIGGLPASFEPHKWVRCLTDFGVYPDGWKNTCLDMRLQACARSEFPDSLNLQLFSSDTQLLLDLEQIRRTIPGAVEVQIFEPSNLTPPMGLAYLHRHRRTIRRELALRIAATAA